MKKQNKKTEGLEPIEPLFINYINAYNHEEIVDAIFLIKNKQDEIIERLNFLLDNRRT